MKAFTTFTAASALLSIADARKPTSYRYGELAEFQASMMQKQSGMFYIIVPQGYSLGKKHTSMRKSWPRGVEASLSHRYGNKQGDLRAHTPGRQLEMSTGKNKRKVVFVKALPSSYRYGCKACQNRNSKGQSMAMNKKRHLKYTSGSMKESKSYRYGQIYNARKPSRKSLMAKNSAMDVHDMMRMWGSTIVITDLVKVRESKLMAAKALTEDDMIIRPFSQRKGKLGNVKRSNQRTIEMIESASRELCALQREVEMLELDHGSAIDGMDMFMEGQFMALAGKEKSASNATGMNKASLQDDLKDKFDGLKDGIELDSEAVRFGISVALGLLITFVLVGFFKVLFMTWVAIGRRRDLEENHVLLKGELESIHPISIVYKN